MPRNTKQSIAGFVDIVFIFLAFFGGLFIRVNQDIGNWVSESTVYAILILVVGSTTIWIRLGVYRGLIRYLDTTALTAIIWGVLASSVLLLILSFVMDLRLPRSIPIVYLALMLVMMMGSRLMLKGVVSAARGNKEVVPVSIYGAGEAGRQLCISLQSGTTYTPVAFFDDDPQLQGRYVSGVPIYSPEHLEFQCERLMVQKLLFAMPSIDEERRRAILASTSNLKMPMLTIPSSEDLIKSGISSGALRKVGIEDLLGRPAAAPSEALIADAVSGKTILVTGAGGSIGSELSRQILKYGAEHLIIFDHAEQALYSIEKALQRMSAQTRITPVLGSVLDHSLVENVLATYKPTTIYHAAAYKHVPLVESNVEVGLRNNIWGTLTVAEAALNKGIKNFILVSSDKAVRPTNIMGASKRLAELVVQSMALRNGGTVFSMVRFGNVLGSSGSVVPLFEEQIRGGGPVTVTHPEVNRYFMTIPEAASLVLQAGFMAVGGEVFVLDMGEPVKIEQLARTMIELYGLKVKDEDNPTGDIEIRFSGLRPGEKLYEELLIGSSVSGTSHPLIMRAEESFLSADALKSILDALNTSLVSGDLSAVKGILSVEEIGYSQPSQGKTPRASDGDKCANVIGVNFA